MRRATKSQVHDLARKVLGAGAYPSARRSFTTWWIVEIFDAKGRIVRSFDEPAIGDAYGAAASWLRSQLFAKEAA